MSQECIRESVVTRYVFDREILNIFFAEAQIQ